MEMENTAAGLNRPLLVRDLEDAIAALDRALGFPPLELIGETSEAERAVARARNRLIDWLHQGDGGAEAERWRGMLEQINIVLTLVISGEYPPAGVQRGPLEQARDSLRALLSDHAL